MVTGIANAFMDSSPMIAITGQVPSSGDNTTYMIGRDAFQEADIIGITTPITKHNYQPRAISEIQPMVNAAFYIASTGRPGPVLIDLPKNIQSNTANIEMGVTEKIEARGYKPALDPDLAKITEAVNLLAMPNTQSFWQAEES